MILIFVTGIVVGIVNGVVGGGSIISYPVLLSIGMTPVNAAVNNSLGVSSANIFALVANVRHGKVNLRSYLHLALASALCAGIGAYLLLSLPSKIFESLAPFLLLGATSTFLIPVRPNFGNKNFSRSEVIALSASGLYCGYFGPGQGVMVLATLSRKPTRTTHEINSAKNFIIGITSIVTSVAFLWSGRVDWQIFVTLFVGSALGGYSGGRFASRVSPILFKVLTMSVGFGASIWLFIHAFF